MSHAASRPSYTERLETAAQLAHDLINECKDRYQIRETARMVIDQFFELITTPKLDFPERVNRAVSATKANLKKKEEEFEVRSWERHIGENLARQALDLAWEVVHGKKSYGRALSRLLRLISDREKRHRESKERQANNQPHPLRRSKKSSAPRTHRRHQQTKASNYRPPKAA